MECIICAETTKKKLVRCEYCDFEACLKCTKMYILSINVPGCMNTKCTGEWSRKFIRNNFSLSFINNDLQKHKKEVLFQSQLALMPETQLIIEEEIRQRNLKKELVDIDCKILSLRNSIQKDITSLFDDYNRMCRFQVVSRAISYTIKRDDTLERKCTLFLNRQLKAMTPTSTDIENAYNEARRKKQQLINDTIQPEIDVLQQRREEVYYSIARKTREQSNFIMKCGNAECKGFLNNHWNCGLCEKKTCKDCHFVGEHETCDPDTVATVKLLKSDTKPCPKCHSNIFKIDGCDQMWCTQCKTAFSWKTGLIETKIHNPHYYEWRRQNGGLEREPGDIPGGGCDQPVIDHRFPYFIPVYEPCFRHVQELVMRLLHISENRNENIRVNNIDRFRGYRLQYLKNQIDEKHLKTQLIRIQKAQSLQVEINNIYQLIVTTVADILFRFRHKAITTSPQIYDLEILSEIQGVVKYTNECFQDISSAYNCNYVYWIDGRLNINRNKF